MGVFSSSGLFGNQKLASIRLSNYFSVDLTEISNFSEGGI